MVEKILEYLDEKAKKEIETLWREKEEMISNLEKDFEKRSKEKIEKERKEIQEKIAKEIEEAKQRKERELLFLFQKKKLKIVREIYSLACQRIQNLSPEILEKVVANLVKKNEKDIFSAKEIIASQRVNKILEKNGIQTKVGLDEEGMIIRKENQEIDLRFSTLILESKEKNDPEIAKSLFANK